MLTERMTWRHMAVATAATMSLIGGCKATEKQDDPAEAEVRVNAAIVQMHFDEQARGGAITGRTIYPYHFIPDQTRLTPLGDDHVRTLALALAELDGKPVRVNVRRGDASTELYDARVAALKERFAQAGVEPEQVAFVDGLGGGKGMSSKSIADAERATASSGRRTRGGTTSAGGPAGPGTGYQNSMQGQGDR